MYDTPQEAALKAEIARLRGENELLRRAVESPGARSVKPWGVEEELVLRDIHREIRLPKVASVHGTLLRLMRAHSDAVDRTKTDGRQMTRVDGTWAIWEYKLNYGIGSERFCHQVVESDLSGLSEPPAMSASQ